MHHINSWRTAIYLKHNNAWETRVCIVCHILWFLWELKQIPSVCLLPETRVTHCTVFKLTFILSCECIRFKSVNSRNTIVVYNNITQKYSYICVCVYIYVCICLNICICTYIYMLEDIVPKLATAMQVRNTQTIMHTIHALICCAVFIGTGRLYPFLRGSFPR